MRILPLEPSSCESSHCQIKTDQSKYYFTSLWSLKYSSCPFQSPPPKYQHNVDNYVLLSRDFIFRFVYMEKYLLRENSSLKQNFVPQEN